jgi:hypothetical protein
MNRMVASILLVSMVGLCQAAEIKPLAEPGKSIFHDNFVSPEFSKQWKKGPGEYQITEKMLTIKEKTSDMHIAALRAMVPVQDAVVKFQFKLEGAKMLHLGFDPAAGELKGRNGHLFNVVIDGKSLSIQKAGDKVNKEIKAKTIQKVACVLKGEEWHSMTFAMVGTKVQAIVDDKFVVEGEDEEFKIKKPALIFRVGGESVHIKAVEVFEVKK